MSETSFDDEETPFGLAKKYQRSMRSSLFIGWLFTALAGGIAYLPLTQDFPFAIFAPLLVLVVICIFISMSHFFDAGYHSAQKEYEPKLLAKNKKHKDLEREYNKSEIFHHKSMFRLVAVCLAKVAANHRRNKHHTTTEVVIEKEGDQN